MRIGIGLGDIDGRAGTFAQIVARARMAEAAGFSSLWMPSMFDLDALSVSMACGLATSRIEVGTSVVPIQPRHPYVMAQQALSVHAAIGHRLTLGIGTSHAMIIEQRLGLRHDRVYAYMQEYLAVLTALIHEGRVQFTGQHFRVNAKLSVPGGRPCPILLGALGPKMLSLAGRAAEGTITWMTGPRTLANLVVPRVLEAAHAAGRPLPRIVAGLPIAVTADVAGARRATATQFCGYSKFPAYRAILDREGVDGPEDILIAGDESVVNERLDEIAACGVTDLFAVMIALQPGDSASTERTWQLLARRAQRQHTLSPAGLQFLPAA